MINMPENPLAISHQVLQQVSYKPDLEQAYKNTLGGQKRPGREPLWPSSSNPAGKKLIQVICSVINAAPKQELSVSGDNVLVAAQSSAVISRFWRRRIIWQILQQPQPSGIFIQLHQQGLLPLVLPALERAHGVTQNHYHAYDVFYHSIYACDHVPADKLVLRLATLFHDLGKVDTRRWVNGEYTFHNHEMAGARLAARFCRSLGCSSEIIHKVRRLIRNHMFHYSPEWTDSAVRRFYRNIGGDLVNDLFLLRLADRKANGKRQGIPGILFQFRDRIEALLQKDQEFTIKDLQINGHELMSELKIKPGPALGQILQHLFGMVKENRLANERSELLQEARRIYRL